VSDPFKPRIRVGDVVRLSKMYLDSLRHVATANTIALAGHHKFRVIGLNEISDMEATIVVRVRKTDEFGTSGGPVMLFLDRDLEAA
jgi:hypothetical protein